MGSDSVDGDHFQNNIVPGVYHVNSYQNRPHFCPWNLLLLEKSLAQYFPLIFRTDECSCSMHVSNRKILTTGIWEKFDQVEDIPKKDKKFHNIPISRDFEVSTHRTQVTHT
jgi:hypothetical protein